MERYESLGLVGEGSYGTVLKCRHRDTGRIVAIKKFVNSDSDEAVKKIANREIKLLRKLSHDNLVNLLEVWKRRRRWYLVFEFVDRTLLEDLEQHPSGLDRNTTRQYLYQILRAAAFCHEQNIIHRDIKPENILVSQGGVVKLCDFGLARSMAAPADVYTDYVATRWYRAPELLVGDVKYGKPVDVWAVGCLFLEMLTGQPLFPGDSELDQIYHIIKCFGSLTARHQELFLRNPVFSGVRLPECSARVPLQDRCPAITPAGLDLAQSCLQMDPDGRAQCSELLEHPLFTLDCFHIRFVDELNAKIQKDHRENSTLPKIIRAQRRDKNDGGDKKPRGKNKGKERKDGKEGETLEKAKGKQPKTVSKQSKTLGARTGVRGNRQEADTWTNEARETGESGSRSNLDTLGQTSERPGGSWSFQVRLHADGTEHQSIASDGAATPTPDRSAPPTTPRELVRDSHPPPAASSPPLLPPPPSTPLTPTFPVTRSSDHLGLGPVRDWTRHHGGLYGRAAAQGPRWAATQSTLTMWQASDRSLVVEQPDLWTYVHSPAPARKVDIYFPDVLPELRGRDGRSYKVVAKDQKKSKTPAPPTSEPQQH